MFRPRSVLLGAVAFAVALLSGCVGHPGAGADAPPGAPLQACPGQAIASGAGLCTWTMDPTSSSDNEPDVAVDPLDGEHVLVGWIEHAPDGWAAWVALTQDGGQTWETTPFAAARAPPLVGGQARHQFDITVAFSGDGRALAFWGDSKDGVGDRLTLAVREPDGWVLREVPSPANYGLLWDAMAMATSRHSVHVVMHSVDVRNVWYLRSDDLGKTWSQPMPMGLVGGPDPAPNHGYFARIRAWQNEVAIHFKSFAGGGYVKQSHDGGRAWQASVQVEPDAGPFVGNPLAVGARGTAVGYAAGSAARLYRSTDEGWTGPVDLRGPSPGLDTMYAAVATSADADAVLLPAQSDTSFEVAFAVVRGDQVARHVLVPMAPHGGKALGSGNEYSGLGVSPDGTWWATWVSPQDGGRLTVARIDL